MRIILTHTSVDAQNTSAVPHVHPLSYLGMGVD